LLSRGLSIFITCLLSHGVKAPREGSVTDGRLLGTGKKCCGLKVARDEKEVLPMESC
jgi:hypothetical protein